VHQARIGPQEEHRPDLQIVAIAEPSQQLARIRSTFRTGAETVLLRSGGSDQKTHPDAVLAYTNTYDHRRVVEICARHGVHVMMEKPLAVSLDDAHAIEKAAREGKIQFW